MESKSLTTLRTVPVVAVRGSVVFPHTDSLLSFGRPKSVQAVNTAYAEDRIIAIFTQKDSSQSDPKLSELYNVGTLAVVSQMMTTDGEIHAMVKGMNRVRLVEELADEPYLVAKVMEITEDDYSGDEVEALTKRLVEQFRKAINMGKGVEITTIMRILSNQTDAVEIVDSVAGLLDMKTADKQELLETFSVKERLNKVLDLITHEISVLDLERMISAKTQKRFEDQMKKAMLREKKRTIEQELGEEDDPDASDDIKEYKGKIKKAKMPELVLEKALKELKRLERMSPHNPETGYIRNYLDWLTDMPWNNTSETTVSLEAASEMLDNDHYGLGKAKERILEFLSVMKLKNEIKAHKGKNGENHPTILCFVGPPGVGKTSIGKSIAKALGRKFVRLSLGGVRDEAELRGHRRTYIGALPGRIIQGIKDAGTNNPVFMLDEIDKLGADYRGDPSSALLEILDPEQNKEFSDHYLEVAYDLSQVMFICTANVLDTIPGPLLDRMEVIRFAGYIADEKFQIAKKYLWPKQLTTHGIGKQKITISDEALHYIVKRYTREAGVRDLERNLATICRKVARKVAEKTKFEKKIEVVDAVKYLGPERFSSQIAGKSDEVGMSTGLAVTSAGGEILFIEVSLMHGKGKLMLTGQLGDVMKESAKAAFTWTRAHARELGLKDDFANNIDVHVHVPEGATPKDGPSAGIAMTTALVSAVTGIPVKRDVGMTGEVTLRGRVMEIGGVKEKVVAGHRAGLSTIILPKDNEKDMEEVPENVKKDINFMFFEKVEDVLPVALMSNPLIGKTDGTPFLPHQHVA
jgi:ATP-dependent Lon protease